MNYLVLTAPDGSEKAYSLSKGELSVGRDSDNDVVIPVAGISRKHARIYTWDNQVFVEDLGSSNGIFINGRRINEAVVIKPGTAIALDAFTLVVQDKEAAGGGHHAWGRLTGRTPPVTGDAYELDQPELFVGRTEENSIVIVHGSISRRHASLKFDKGGPHVVDLDSSNGTFINGKRIKEAALVEGCTVTFGDVAFDFDAPSAPARAADPVVPATSPAPGSRRFGRAPLVAALAIFLILVLLVVAGAIKKRRFAQKALHEEAAGKKGPSAEEYARERLDRARGLIEKERWAEAMTEVQNALDKDPLSADARKAKKTITEELENKRLFDDAEMSLAFGKFEEARGKYQKVPRQSAFFPRASPKIKEIDKRLSTAAFAEAKKLQKRGDPKKLHEALCKALDIDPDNAEARRMLDKTEELLRRKKAKFTEWKPPARGTKDDLYSFGSLKDPDAILSVKYPDERIRKPMVLYFRGKSDEALRELNKLVNDKKATDLRDRAEALQRDIFNVRGKYTEGSALLLQGSVREAARTWRPVLETDAKLVPTNPPSNFRDEIQRSLAEAYVKTGTSFFDKGRFEEAFEQTKQAVEVAPDNIEVIYAVRKLKRAAERMLEDAILSANPAEARAKLKAITTMTLPGTQIYKMAEAKLREMK